MYQVEREGITKGKMAKKLRRTSFGFFMGLEAFTEIKSHFLQFFLPVLMKPVDSLSSNAIHNYQLRKKGKGALRAGSLFPGRSQYSIKDKSTKTHKMINLFISQNLVCCLIFPAKRGQPRTSLRPKSQTCPSTVHRQLSPSEVQQKSLNLGQVFWFQIVTQFLLTDPYMMALLPSLGKVSS